MPFELLCLQQELLLLLLDSLLIGFELCLLQSNHAFESLYSCLGLILVLFALREQL